MGCGPSPFFRNRPHAAPDQSRAAASSAGRCHHRTRSGAIASGGLDIGYGDGGPVAGPVSCAGDHPGAGGKPAQGVQAAGSKGRFGKMLQFAPRHPFLGAPRRGGGDAADIVADAQTNSWKNEREPAVGRKNGLSVGSPACNRQVAAAAIADTLIATAKLNGVDPQAWPASVLGRIADRRIARLDKPMPCHYARPGR